MYQISGRPDRRFFKNRVLAGFVLKTGHIPDFLKFYLKLWQCAENVKINYNSVDITENTNLTVIKSRRTKHSERLQREGREGRTNLRFFVRSDREKERVAAG